MKILEIGPGEYPMILHGGTLFELPELDYHAIEPVPDYVDRANRHLAEDVPQFAGRVVVADSARIPHADESVDLVVMKDVFGEYTMPPDRTGSLVENTRLGVYEYFRVLKPGGAIVVIEENTPDKLGEASDVAMGLVSARFQNLRYFPRHHKQNPLWQAERSKYIKPTAHSTEVRGKIPEWTDDYYIMTATRPASPGYRLFEATIGDNEVKQRRRAEVAKNQPCSTGNLAIQALFQLSSLHPVCDPHDEDAVRRNVQVYCDKDDVSTLQDEYAANGWLRPQSY